MEHFLGHRMTRLDSKARSQGINSAWIPRRNRMTCREMRNALIPALVDGWTLLETGLIKIF